MQVHNSSAGMKTTVQVGSNLWIKLRIENRVNATFTADVTPRVRLWAETDF